MTPFIVLVAATTVLIASAVVGTKTKNQRLRSAMQGATAVALLVAAACVFIGLWQAWAPWDLELVRK